MSVYYATRNNSTKTHSEINVNRLTNFLLNWLPTKLKSWSSVDVLLRLRWQTFPQKKTRTPNFSVVTHGARGNLNRLFASHTQDFLRREPTKNKNYSDVSLRLYNHTYVTLPIDKQLLIDVKRTKATVTSLKLVNYWLKNVHYCVKQCTRINVYTLIMSSLVYVY